MENASYGLTICAERNALAAAVTAGHVEFRRLALVSDAPEPISPCGSCRQALMEFGPDMVVESWAGDEMRRWTMAELLPDAFSRNLLS